MTSNQRQRRSPAAQLTGMTRLWPDFRGRKLPNGILLWMGPLKPKAQTYTVAIFWKPREMDLPYVTVEEPKLQPRPGGTFEEIPHLIFYKDKPEQSGLCLFDPASNEWTEADLIAETTVFWASEWLAYYELWHLTGQWLAPGVGYESVAQMQAAQAKVIREALADVH